MQARYYDPVIDRFYSKDPVGYTPQNPVMSFNRYLYVNNNPYKYTDPNELSERKDWTPLMSHFWTDEDNNFFDYLIGGLKLR